MCFVIKQISCFCCRHHHYCWRGLTIRFYARRLMVPTTHSANIQAHWLKGSTAPFSQQTIHPYGDHPQICDREVYLYFGEVEISVLCMETNFLSFNIILSWCSAECYNLYLVTELIALMNCIQFTIHHDLCHKKVTKRGGIM